MPQTCEKPFNSNIRVVLCKKPLEKNTKYSRSETTLKVGHLAKAIPMQNGQFGSKIKNTNPMRKTILQERYNCCVQKTARKNIKYSKNETILKIGHLARAIAYAKPIAFAKWSDWVKS